MKKALVVRYGAFGDMVVITPLLKLLKQSGYHVTVNCLDRGAPVIENNPNVDATIIQKDNQIPNEKLGEYWDQLKAGYDVFINLSGSIEESLLKIEGQAGFEWSKEKRHAACDKNYYDHTLHMGGYFFEKGMNPELYFTEKEEAWAKELRAQFRNRFVILWPLSGSSFHKVWHKTEETAVMFLNNHPDAVIFTVGGNWERVMEWTHPQTRKRCGQWSIRKTMLMTKYADLVIGPETGVINAAACYDTPKILFLSHSTVENICKYWKNCYPIVPDQEVVPCYPCHQLHHTLDSCPTKVVGEVDRQLIKTPLCMGFMNQTQVYDTMEMVYQDWKEKKNGSLCREGRQAILR